MQKIENNVLNPTISKGFNKANTNKAYNAYFLTVVDDLDFLNFAKSRVEDGSFHISFMLRANEELNEEMQKKILHGVKLLKENFIDVEFKISFASTMRYYSCEEFKKLLEIKQHIIENYNENFELNFVEGDMQFTEKEILTANSKISEVVNTIKNENLSPLEAVMYVHRLLTERTYFKDGEGYKNRNIYSVLNQKDIICTGFANLFAAIFLELNDPRIKVKEAVISMNNNSWYHAINNVYINDEKYAYEGYYSLDACANVQQNKPEGLDFFMIPIMDIPYSYKDVGNKRFVLETNEGNLGNNTIPFDVDAEYYGSAYNISHKLYGTEFKHKNSESVLDSTKEFLNTNLANKIKKQFENDYGEEVVEQEKLYSKVISKVLRTTKPISIADLESAYTVITKKFIKTKDISAEKYAQNVIMQAIDDVPNVYSNISLCQNEFAQEYKNLLEQSL